MWKETKVKNRTEFCGGSCCHGTTLAGLKPATFYILVKVLDFVLKYGSR